MDLKGNCTLLHLVMFSYFLITLTLSNLRTCGHTVHHECVKAVSKAHKPFLLKIFHEFHQAHLKKPDVTSHSKGVQNIGKSKSTRTKLVNLFTYLQYYKLLNNKITNYFLHKAYLLNTGKYSMQIAFQIMKVFRIYIWI